MAGMQSPLSPLRTQSAQRFQQQRMTQPLNPQTVLGLGREREPVQEPGQYATRQMRQVVPYAGEQYAPVAATPPPPPVKGSCPRCRGAGYLRADVPFGDPNFGKPIPCECKEAERRERRRQQLRDMSNLDAFRSNSFRTFNPRVPGLYEAYQVASAYAENPQGWLLLVGPNGCGKTHLAAAIANQCLDSGAVVLFAVVPDLLDHLRAAFAPSATEVYDQLFSKMREAEVLVLDDLGAQQSSPWANEKLFQLLNYRYNMSMPTVITANPRGLQGIDERIRSRLSDISLVKKVTFDRAHDYRPNHPRRDM
jgi:DNA replication protein DnaC